MLRVSLLFLALVTSIICYPYYGCGNRCSGYYGAQSNCCCQPTPGCGACTQWVCPKDPVLRQEPLVQKIEAFGGGPTACQYDEQCPDVEGKPHKCCYDSSTNGKVCKPAVPSSW